MIRSMTGFGRGQRIFENREITVEIKSVNHRFFECGFRTPRGMSFLEERLKSLLGGGISRGKVEVAVTMQSTRPPETVVEVNQDLARSYVKALRQLGEDLSLTDDLTVTGVSRLPDLFTVRRLPEDEELVWEQVRETAADALTRFLEMREREGARMAADLHARLDALEAFTKTVKEQSPKTAEAYRARLTAKITEVLADKQIDESRILTEAAIFADRIAVDEETVRLESHLEQFRHILQQEGAIGRKLDFLVQEINRETNTIGSKCQDVVLARVVVDMKSEVEKLREQLQNIE